MKKNPKRFLIAIVAMSLWALPAFATEYCADKDHDMHADANSPDDCVAPVNPKTGKPVPKDDCDDNDAGIHPGAAEIRGNGIDENCKVENGDAANCPDANDLCLDPRAVNFIGPNPSNAALVRLYQEWDRCTDAKDDNDNST